MNAYPSLSGQPLVDVLRLIRTPGIGPVTFFTLLQRYGTAENALRALPELSRKGGRKTPLTAIACEDAEKEIALAQAFGATFILYGAPDYPALLTTIPDAPPVVTVRGNAALWKKKTIAMVGARNASATGCQFAHRLARDLGADGYAVASGLARGIDTFVHKGSLATGTVAVIAGGIDTVYPPENAPLYNEIFERGLIVSEQPFGAAPFAGSFPARNRIIAGMSLGTVVVEASPKSGSLITARLAGEYNREVFAVPGSPMDPRSKGCNQLIRQGAAMVENALDIIEGLSHIRTQHFAEKPAGLFQPTPPSEDELSDMREKIAGKLSSCPVSIDELIEQCATTAAVVQTVTLELELAGRLKRAPGNKVYVASQTEAQDA